MAGGATQKTARELEWGQRRRGYALSAASWDEGKREAERPQGNMREGG